MRNANALAVYGIEENTPKKIYEIGLMFFEAMGLSITSAAYYKYREDRSEEDLYLIDVSLSDLRLAIENGSATSFRLYHESNSRALWDASFGYSTKDFGGFYHIDAQGLASHFSQEKFLEFASNFCTTGSMDYAIFYSTDDVTDAFYYAAGGNFVRVYDYEDPDLFNMETGGVFEGAELYKKEKLRMTYSANIINDAHLALRIGAYSLREWISSDASHGALRQGPRNLWFWTVDERELDKVNNELGTHGVLISWKPPKPPKKPRKIP
ncbi:hypothetical protein Q6A49_05415 [Pseudomonas sp. 22-AL-CL-001]|uniref:hypothetical protein n=1 Tax=Pseudomonas alabamensis TaxID=3064349 RepID=UPI0027143778|nr:hypothetical protein [Pseudomonas sp. 22-AL-CL-001]MDO7909969.1 hypothetical protein [Pseudomonas sp. 22-AL-CL-001]